MTPAKKKEREKPHNWDKHVPGELSMAERKIVLVRGRELNPRLLLLAAVLLREPEGVEFERGLAGVYLLVMFIQSGSGGLNLCARLLAPLHTNKSLARSPVRGIAVLGRSAYCPCDGTKSDVDRGMQERLGATDPVDYDAHFDLLLVDYLFSWPSLGNLVCQPRLSHQERDKSRLEPPW